MNLLTFPVPVLDELSSVTNCNRGGEQAQESTCPANRKQATNTIKGMDSRGGETLCNHDWQLIGEYIPKYICRKCNQLVV